MCTFRGAMFVFRGVRNRSFARSFQGRIHRGPENKCAPRSLPHLVGVKDVILCLDEHMANLPAIGSAGFIGSEIG
jgi:hypothetical protein